MQNMAPDMRPEGNGQKGAVAIALYSVGYIDDDTLDKAIVDRAVSFLDEAKLYIKAKPFGWSKPTIALTACVICDMEKVRLSATASFHHEGKVNEGETDIFKRDVVQVKHVIFEVVDEGSEDVRRRLHPPRGSGSISEEAKHKVFDGFLDFVLMANRRGIAVQSIAFGRGLMWMNGDEFQNGDLKKQIEEANDGGGNKIIWMPDTGYLMEDAMSGVMGAVASSFGL